jgi:hypothetical protein
MGLIVASAFLLAVALPLVGDPSAVWLLVCSQLCLLINEVRKRQISGAGAFVFMSFLFFGVRPLFILVEKDYRLFIQVFRVAPSLDNLTEAMWWGTCALLCFVIGAHFSPRINRKWVSRRLRRFSLLSTSVPSRRFVLVVMAVQLLTVPIIFSLGQSGRGLYGSDFGAYAYLLPAPLQAVHILAVVALVLRVVRSKAAADVILLTAATALFLLFTWLMRDVSAFRGFYLSGLMIAGLASLMLFRRRVGYLWLIIPIVGLMPVFEYLGEQRHLDSEELVEEGVVEGAFRGKTLPEAYWFAYSSRSDMNIFDTFVGALHFTPKNHAYVLSWLYVPFHFVPRFLWSGKPERGVMQDMSFTRGRPFNPGVAGLFFLDGGLLWMLVCMIVLGFLVAAADLYALTLPRTYWRSCLISILAVNGMFLSRFTLWQYFYQALYMILPILLLIWLFDRNILKVRNKRQPSAARGGRRLPAET